MAAIDMIKRRLKEARISDSPEEIGEKKKRPREVAFMDVNLREKMNAEERALLARERVRP